MYKRKFRPYPPIVKRRRVHYDFPRWFYILYFFLVSLLVLFSIIITDLYLKMNWSLLLHGPGSTT